MPQLPEYPSFEHLKKQAKDLLRLYAKNDPEAFGRFRKSLPAAQDKDDAAISAMGLKLQDAQSCIAREYGFSAWRNLRNYVDWSNSKLSADRKDVIALWLHKAYGHETERADPVVAANQLKEIPDFVQGDLFLACTIGDEQTVRTVIARDRSAMNRISHPWPCPGCKKNLGMPPLFAAAHSTLLRLPEFRGAILRCARLLLDAGADPNQSWTDPDWNHRLTALYGAAGKNHDAELTRILLGAGADPNDGESLYHALETPDKTCVRLLLEAGARVEGSNALHHQLDADDLDGLRLLLRYTKDANDSDGALGNPLIWAIRRRRSADHVKALLDAGANPRAATGDGVDAYRFALQFGLEDVAALLRQSGAGQTLSIEDEFVAACARVDRSEAGRILATHPDIFERLSQPQLRQLPNLTESGNHEAVRLMVEAGWPIAARGGDWNATALNLAVYQGNEALVRFLLEHGASWRERHGHDGDVRGTLWWACMHRDPSEGDWAACARALVEHGMPLPESSERYSPEVAAYFASARRK